jgi:hypothetical protein
MRYKLAALFLLVSCAAAAATPLSAEDRLLLEKGTTNSCLENQVKDADNKAMTVGQLWVYCDCYAKAFFEGWTVEDVQKNKDALMPEAARKAAEYSKKCAASTLKK